MKISIDLDGTLWNHMNLFRTLMKLMQADGHQVGILTGHQHESAEDDTKLLVANGFPAPDFYFGRLPEDLPFNGAISKSRWILREGIDYHYDDLDYGLPETLALFQQCLGDQIHRLIIIRHRERSAHLE